MAQAIKKSPNSNGTPPTSEEKAVAFMLKRLSASGLSTEDVDTVPFSTTGKDGAASVEGFKIPYRDLWSGEQRPEMYRNRLNKEDHPHIKSKYEQPARVSGIFVPKNLTIETFARATTWMIVEGELKAAAAHKYLSVPVLGVGGSCGFSYKRRLAEEIVQCVKPNDTIFVVFDGDAIEKHEIGVALGTLSRALVALGAKVLCPQLPASKREVARFVRTDLGVS